MSASPADVIAGRAPFALVCGDCLAPDGLPALPDRSVQHVITDPPYEADAHKGARRCPKPGDAAGEYEIGFAAITDEARDAVALHAARTAAGWALAFCQVEAVGAWRSAMERGGLSWRRAMVWVKPDSAPQFTGDRPGQGFECIASAWAGKGRSRWNAGGKRGVYVHGVNDFGRLTSGRPHPTMKPLKLMEELIADFTDPGEIILDPFMGSGTTGLACLRLGRRFIGFERDPQHFETAMRRLTGDEVRPAPGQMVLFGAAR